MQVARAERLDIVHAHYAIPHATAAYLARQILAAPRSAGRVPRVITTLHGTDITLVGSDPSYSETVAFSIEQSDGVTAVSESLQGRHLSRAGRARATSASFRTSSTAPCTAAIAVPASARRGCARPRREADRDPRLELPAGEARRRGRRGFARIRREVPARLLMVGDGPDLGDAVRLARDAAASPTTCSFVGEQDQVLPLLSVADLFLLPSAQESFGLAALEAMACEVPVVASRVGGLPEVITHGETGFLHAPDDLEGMARSAVRVLTDEQLHRRVAGAARRAVHQRFCDVKIVPIYEAYLSGSAPVRPRDP